MSESFPELSLPVLALIFIGVMAVLAVARGVMRLFRAVIALAIGFAVGTVVFLRAPEWLAGISPEFPGKWAAGLSVVSGAVAHLGSVRLLSRLSGGPAGAGGGNGTMPGWLAALLSLLPSMAIIWAAGVFVRVAGSLSGMAHLDRGHGTSVPWLARAGEALSDGPIGRVFDLTDPVVSPERRRLCELLVSYRESGRWNRVKHDARFKAAVSHPKFQRLLNDREIRRAVSFSDYPRLLTLAEVREAAADPSLAIALRRLPEPEVRRAEPVR